MPLPLWRRQPPALSSICDAAPDAERLFQRPGQPREAQPRLTSSGPYTPRRSRPDVWLAPLNRMLCAHGRRHYPAICCCGEGRGLQGASVLLGVEDSAPCAHPPAGCCFSPGGWSDRHLPGRWPGVSVHPAPGASGAITLFTNRKGPTGLLYRLSWDKFFLRFPWSLELEREGVQPRIDKLGSEVVWDFANFEIKL